LRCVRCVIRCVNRGAPPIYCWCCTPFTSPHCHGQTCHSMRSSSAADVAVQYHTGCNPKTKPRCTTRVTCMHSPRAPDYTPRNLRLEPRPCKQTNSQCNHARRTFRLTAWCHASLTWSKAHASPWHQHETAATAAGPCTAMQASSQMSDTAGMHPFMAAIRRQTNHAAAYESHDMMHWHAHATSQTHPHEASHLPSNPSTATDNTHHSPLSQTLAQLTQA